MKDLPFDPSVPPFSVVKLEDGKYAMRCGGVNHVSPGVFDTEEMAGHARDLLNAGYGMGYESGRLIGILEAVKIMASAKVEIPL